MTAGGTPLLALFPGGLGDFLCCWTALDALRQRDGLALTLAARGAWLALIPPDLARPLSIERREIADLFGSEPLARGTRALFGGFARVESWTGFGNATFARRLIEASGATVHVHRFDGFAAGEHAAHYYARCLGVTPRLRPLAISAAAADWAAALWHAHGLGERVLVVHAGSGSARKNWEGSPPLAAAWRADGGQVVALIGPAEAERPAPIVADLSLRDQPLDRIAALLRRAHRFLGNDSGISHLAGLVGARGVAVFGPTDPRTWAPLGDGIRVLRGEMACPTCGVDRLCVHRVPRERVAAALT